MLKVSEAELHRQVRVPTKTIERQWYWLSELSMTNVLSTRTSGLPDIQAVTASPSDSRSILFVAVKTFTTFDPFGARGCETGS